MSWTVESPVVLTGTGTRFSAGLDLEEHFPLFAGDEAAVASWFQGYRATSMRLFTYPRPTVAAVNGHAFAGGLITAAVCDHRVSVPEGARYAPADRVEQYAFTKRAAQAAALRDIAELSDPLDRELPAGMTSEHAWHAHRRHWQELKGSPAPW
ncbi:enoyl-CoA hydratase/isomerase family protein [Streptomyces cylindrosporus]|uniref:Enoyl-CoA hydratase/isomerase family protein n=1 Tax=Streptomyces cylindrosporus TaxID=2927583 RepID=A0ABS9YB04_9ACTN|nr:enoyl-CoA hydratase/isomerase family protein [Streptomyces cylindrosporus]MCI3274400.1 enoyl-CoA hydratase/isomerase family protein [Streptomyces cylindrosporus]